MSLVRRIYVEKKPEYATAARALKEDLTSFLGIPVDSVRILIRYDVENVSDEVFETACRCVFSEPPVDVLYRDAIEVPEGTLLFSVEPLPGQFDQRADSAEQCLRFINENESPTVHSATTYLITGDITPEDEARIRSYCVNPVDSGFTDETIPETLSVDYPVPADVAVLDGFTALSEEALGALYDSLNLAMTRADFDYIRDYFRDEEKRDPSITEIRVLDTYWSDHCRHTTFATELTEIEIDEGRYAEPIRKSFDDYMDERKVLYQGKDRKICLMDLALIGMRSLKASGALTDMEESEEINACSVIVPIQVTRDGQTSTEEWLLFFKNETHNHPTEIEPFGGAATCLGGAIRDPLSGRGYVYQAMRVTGAADPTASADKTLPGKLPQKKLVKTAAAGYSSYGNQIGLATGLVREIYHPDYVAKRMEIGAVLGAAPRSNVMRESSRPGDVIILLGGRTGRDGIGGATGSSKVHTEKSLTECGAEVQKGNAPTERKLQRLFRRPEVARLIRKCNDFGAGGVSVAIGELADGLVVDLDKVPKKYEGLDGTELAISESQERMAVVVGPQDEAAFMAYAAEENLEATKVAVVTEEPRLKLCWRGKPIVDLSRAYLDTNGAPQHTKARVECPDAAGMPIPEGARAAMDAAKAGHFAEALTARMGELTVCSQRGLAEMFDSTIGAGTVMMPFGGRTQRTPADVMVARFPVLSGTTDAVSIMSYGFDPYLSAWSPYHGAVDAVTLSLSRLVSAGGDDRKVHFTFQEYFRRMSAEPARWSQPVAALLGAYAAQKGYGLASIGGKDSMSGSFNDIDVPPTLVSFAVGTGTVDEIITPDLKHPGDQLLWVKIPRDSYGLPVYAKVIDLYAKVRSAMRRGQVLAAQALDMSGAAASAVKMALGNELGLIFDEALPAEALFAPAMADLVLEMSDADAAALQADLEGIAKACTLARVTEAPGYAHKGQTADAAAILAVYEAGLDRVYPHKAEIPGADPNEDAALPLMEAIEARKAPAVRLGKDVKPRVFIPVFPGTNCEYDSAAAFEKAGAQPIVKVFRNLSAADIRESSEAFAEGIRSAQILFFPGGFSAGDEPDGSAKFFATAFRGERLREATEDLLHNRDGLALGICNGFQALIKLGLVPHGSILGQDEDSPTLTFNTIGRHISREAYVRVVSNKSPWLAGTKAGEVFVAPASHGEGRFVAGSAWIEKLVKNGQVATQYCDPDGNVLLGGEWNLNGSVCAIEGITSPDGRVFGKMCHAERTGEGIALNIAGNDDMRLFASGVAYFR